MISLPCGLALFALSIPLACATACGDDDSPSRPDAGHVDAGPDANAAGGQLLFELPATATAAIPIATLPFPNDALKDAAGELQITAATLPFDPKNADPSVVENIARAFSDRDCFGVTGSVWFPFSPKKDGEVIDPEAIAGSVHLIALPGGDEVPVDIHFLELEDLLYIRPQRGVILAQAQTYAVIIDAGVTSSAGPITQSPTLAAILDGTEASGRAQAAFAPLLTYLGEKGIASTEVAGATVFSTCEYDADLEAVRDQLDARAPAAVTVAQVYSGASLEGFLGTPDDNTFPGHDNPGGIAHSAISHVILGTFPAPSYTTATPGQLGTFTRGDSGAPEAKGTENIPFLLALPATDSYADLPAVIFQHGLNNSRQAVMAMANTLAAKGFAVIGIDIPFHGDRLPTAKDRIHNFTGADGADGLADSAGQSPSFSFFDINGDEAAGVTPLDAAVMADNLRQAVADVMSLSRLVKDGDFSAVVNADAALTGLSFDADHVVLSSESFGSIISASVVAFDPNLRAGFLSVGGGGIVNELLENSPSYSVFIILINGSFSIGPFTVEDPAHTHYAYGMLEMLLEPGDPITYASRVAENQANVVLAAAYSDESVSNQSSEALAAAMGLAYAQVPGGAPEPPRYVDASRLPAITGPVTGNHPIAGGDALTFALIELHPASHGMITGFHGQRTYAIGFPPFEKLDDPIDIDNPIVALQNALANYAITYKDTGTPTLSFQ
ncbi:MAG TPA: hypothetical protein VFG83_08355 [Kofleriaceae bacterium]|nr:hypothetical protein [Kofleriaceae bacterium]